MIHIYKILRKRKINENIFGLEVCAPLVSKRAQPGQFIMLRIDETGERIPLTIADFDRVKGSVTIIFQTIGKTTTMLGALGEGDEILDFVGPLGVATHLEGYKKVAVIGGGLGLAIAYPQAKKLASLGTEVHCIAGFRNKDLIILEKELDLVSDKFTITTDDGSNGRKGFVTNVLKEFVEEGHHYDLVIAIGPLIMMKVVSDLTKELGIKTIVSMNPVMIDGTGMCGGCRVTVDNKIKFACVDGPDFDGHLVDFDEAMRRQTMYKEKEQKSLESHKCNLEAMKNEK